MIVPKDYNHRHPEIDRDCHKQKAFVRYARLNNFKKSELSFEEQLFLDNFEVAMHYLWGFPKGAITTSVNATSVAIAWNKAS
jgi:hypothetical protein